jgi:hypothetical protein
MLVLTQGIAGYWTRSGLIPVSVLAVMSVAFMAFAFRITRLF